MDVQQDSLSARCAAMLDAVPAHIALLDSDGVIIAVNEAWRRFASANVASGTDFFLGRNYVAVCEQAIGNDMEEAGDVAVGLRLVLSGELAEFALEYPCHSPTTQRWYRMMVTPLHADQRAGAVVMHVDVTTRKQDEVELRNAERLARESEQRLGFALDAAEIGDWNLDLHTNEAHRSLRHDQCFGYTELLPQWGYDTFLAHVHPSDREHVNAGFQAAMAGLGEYNHDFRTTWPDGTEHWLWTRGRFYFDEWGKVNLVMHGGLYGGDLTSSSWLAGGSLGFFITEDFGVAGEFDVTPLTLDLDAPLAQFFNDNRFEPGLAYVALGNLFWSPIHAKLKLGGGIVHTDIMVFAGAGRMIHEAVQGLSFDAGFAIDMFATNVVSIRLTVRDLMAVQEVAAETRFTNNLIATAGISIWIPTGL